MKRNAILLQEAYRRDGHADFIKRASEVCGVPRSTLKKWRRKEKVLTLFVSRYICLVDGHGRQHLANI